MFWPRCSNVEASVLATSSHAPQHRWFELVVELNSGTKLRENLHALGASACPEIEPYNDLSRSRRNKAKGVWELDVSARRRKIRGVKVVISSLALMDGRWILGWEGATPQSSHGGKKPKAVRVQAQVSHRPAQPASVHRDQTAAPHVRYV